MAFLSDIYLPGGPATGNHIPEARRRINWRLILALSVNLAIWTCLVQGARGLF